MSDDDQLLMHRLRAHVTSLAEEIGERNVFNSEALDAGARTVLILDLDAHCGGGTHELIHGDERIWQIDVSVDAFDRYEPLGNNQLEMVHDASRYLPTIEQRLTWLEREAPRFDICLYNAGMDPFGGCSVGGMQGITQKVLRDREVAVFSWCRMRGVPIAFVLAGGYFGPELECAGLVALHRLTLEAACENHQKLLVSD